MQTARTVAMKGALSPFLIPKHGFYAPRDGKGPTVLPNDVSFTYRLRTLWKEMALRARLAPKGFVRGLQGTGIVGIGRLYASVIRADVAALLTVSGAVVSASLGTFSVTLTAAALTLAAGTYYYDVQRTDAASVAVLSIGAFVISQEVRVP